MLMQLSPEALETLAQGMKTLDGSLSLGGQGLAGEIVLFTRFMEKGPMDGMECDSLALWSFGFSARLAAADHAHSMARMDSQYRELTAREDCVDLRALTSLFQEATGTRNPISRLLLPNLGATTQTRLQAIARLRLVRMAVDHALGRPIQVLTDPAGGMLHAEEQKSGAVNFSSDQHDCLSFSLEARASSSK